MVSCDTKWKVTVNFKDKSQYKICLKYTTLPRIYKGN
jgi:hypothetical protein